MMTFIPDYLQPAFKELLGYRPSEMMLSQEEFADKHEVGHANPLGPGGARYFYDYDFGEDANYVDWSSDIDKMIILGEKEGIQKGYKFGSEEDAYKAYKEHMEKTYKGKSVSANIFDPSSMLSAIAKARGKEVGELGDPGMFTAFTPEMFRKLQPGYYQEDVEEGRTSLLDSLTGKVAKAKGLGGGFAGYGKRERQKDIAKESYLGGMESIYSGIGEKSASALQNIYDVLGQYESVLDI